MKVLLAGACTFPDEGGAPARALHLIAKGLAEAGSAVEVVTQSNTLGACKLSFDGFRVSSAASHRPTARGTLAWAEINARFGALLLERAARGDYDAVFVYGISPTFLLAKAMAAARRQRFVVIVGDTLERRDTRPLFRSVERLLLRRASLVVVMGSPELENRLRSWKTGATIVRVWPPVDVDYIASGDPEKARRAFALPRDNVIVHAGAVNSLEGIPDLLDALALLSGRHARQCTLVVAGHEATIDPLSGRRFSVADEATRRGLGRQVKYLGVLGRDDVRNLYAAATVLVSAKVDHEINRMAAPIRIGEYLASGRPVVASRLPNLEGWLRHEQELLFFTAGDAPDLAKTIVRVLDRRADLDAMTRNARQKALAVAGHSVWARRVLQTLESTGGSRAP